jgi:hypothetical protein
MAGTIVANTINTDTGIFSTNNAYSGIAKAWVNFVASASPTINSSFNVSSVTYSTTGTWIVNFTTAFSASTYTVHPFGNGPFSNNSTLYLTQFDPATASTSALTLYVTTSNTGQNPTLNNSGRNIGCAVFSS